MTAIFHQYELLPDKQNKDQHNCTLCESPDPPTTTTTLNQNKKKTQNSHFH